MAKKVLTALSLTVFFAIQAIASGGIELRSVAEVEISAFNSKGEKEIRRVEAAKANVVPGDAVIFTTVYTYLGEKPATNIVINNPVPEHMLYVDGSAEGKNTRIEFSVDQGKTFAAANRLKVRDAKGKERLATAADYTHIRWTMDHALERGANGSVSFRARVK